MALFSFRGWYVPEKNYNQLVTDDDGNYHFWSDGGGDIFMSGISIENVNYCPICGRHLNDT